MEKIRPLPVVWHRHQESQVESNQNSITPEKKQDEFGGNEGSFAYDPPKHTLIVDLKVTPEIQAAAMHARVHNELAMRQIIQSRQNKLRMKSTLVNLTVVAVVGLACFWVFQHPEMLKQHLNSATHFLKSLGLF